MPEGPAVPSEPQSPHASQAWPMHPAWAGPPTALPVQPAWAARPPAVPRVSRLWPTRDASGASPLVLGAGLAVGLLASLTIRDQLVGAAYVTSGLAALAVAFGGRPRRPTVAELGFAAVAVALLSVGAVRSAEWLVVPCLLAALAVGTLALVGARTWTGVLVGALASWLAPPRALGWVRRAKVGRVLPARSALVIAITALLVAVFGALFAAADKTYAHLVASAVPWPDLAGLWCWLLVLAVATTVVLCLAYLSHRPPALDALAPPAGQPVPRWEWAVPLLVLDLLFLSFVLVQVPVLFGGREHVLTTRGLSYASYARQGFWQLLVVTVLTLAVVAVAVRLGPRSSGGDALMVRTVLGILCALALVIVASAMQRMWIYQQEYGVTRLRLAIDATELALGTIFLLVLCAGVRMSGRWLPRAVVVLTALALLGLAVVNPDAYIATHNVQRFEETGKIDVYYLSTLSPDAVPALLELPARLRSCALGGIAADVKEAEDPWYDGNLSRARARDLLSRTELGKCEVGPETGSNGRIDAG